MKAATEFEKCGTQSLAISGWRNAEKFIMIEPFRVFEEEERFFLLLNGEEVCFFQQLSVEGHIVVAVCPCAAITTTGHPPHGPKLSKPFRVLGVNTFVCRCIGPLDFPLQARDAPARRSAGVAPPPPRS